MNICQHTEISVNPSTMREVCNNCGIVLQLLNTGKKKNELEQRVRGPCNLLREYSALLDTQRREYEEFLKENPPGPPKDPRPFTLERNVREEKLQERMREMYRQYIIDKNTPTCAPRPYQAAFMDLTSPLPETPVIHIPKRCPLYSKHEIDGIWNNLQPIRRPHPETSDRTIPEKNNVFKI